MNSNMKSKMTETRIVHPMYGLHLRVLFQRATDFIIQMPSTNALLHHLIFILLQGAYKAAAKVVVFVN